MTEDAYRYPGILNYNVKQILKERPKHVSIDRILSHELGSSTTGEKQALSDLLDLIAFLESRKKNLSQVGGGPGKGYYQLESTTDGGGYTRANTAYSRIPFELTPQWLHENISVARDGDQKISMGVLNKSQQDFIMSAYLLNDENSKQVINNLANEDDPSTRLDMMLNYWLDYHWAGWQEKKNEESVRSKKKVQAIHNIKKDYQYNPNWLELKGSLGYEFNMDNYNTK